MGEKKKPAKKNLAFESLDVDLNKTTDLEAGKTAVGAEEKPKPEPKKKVVAKKVKKEKSLEVVEELIRTTIDFPKSEHRKLKILAMDKDMKLYQYLYKIVKDHLNKIS